MCGTSLPGADGLRSLLRSGICTPAPCLAWAESPFSFPFRLAWWPLLFWPLTFPVCIRRFRCKTLLTILVPASIVFLLGVYDDLHTVGPYVKFAVQSLAATMLFMGGLRILNIPVLFGEHQLPWFVGLPFTILWVLAITNAFNLIDGLDGLAAGSALFSTLVAFVVTLLNGYSLVTVMTIALAGAILGFLRYNFNPATIFLGDSGSLLHRLSAKRAGSCRSTKSSDHRRRCHSRSFLRPADSGDHALHSPALDQRPPCIYRRP